tara:strand:- start:243 stop:584 length:342 start_codon:yes stop_codon:yes gene_type:complete
VRDTEEKWFYFRFWTESFWAAIASTPDLMGHPLDTEFLQDLSLLVLKVEHGIARWTVIRIGSEQSWPGRPFMDEEHRGALNAKIEPRGVKDEIYYVPSGENPGKMTFKEGTTC